jgi:hypothetical protein
MQVHARALININAGSYELIKNYTQFVSAATRWDRAIIKLYLSPVGVFSVETLCPACLTFSQLFIYEQQLFNDITLT